jgi:hypothetical protein
MSYMGHRSKPCMGTAHLLALLNGLCEDVNLPTNQRSQKFRNGFISGSSRAVIGHLSSGGEGSRIG